MTCILCLKDPDSKLGGFYIPDRLHINNLLINCGVNRKLLAWWKLQSLISSSTELKSSCSAPATLMLPVERNMRGSAEIWPTNTRFHKSPDDDGEGWEAEAHATDGDLGWKMCQHQADKTSAKPARCIIIVKLGRLVILRWTFYQNWTKVMKEHFICFC